MRVKVNIVEVAETGPEVTETKTFPNTRAAEKFVKKFNEKHGIAEFDPKPRWYMYAKIAEEG